MIKEVIGIGKTVDEARENAVTQLNAPFEADVKFEVVEMPKKKAFGIFGKETPAKVKAYYELPDEKPATKPAPAAKEKKANKPAAPAAKAPVAQPSVKKPVANPEAFEGTKAYIRSILFRNMKTAHIYHNLLYMTQIGLSMSIPPILSMLAAGWLQQRFQLGDWVMLLGILFGIGGMITNLLEYVRLFSNRAKKETEERIAFNKRW